MIKNLGFSMSCPWNNSPRMDKGSFDWMQTIKSKQDIREDGNRIFRPASSIRNHSMSLLTSWVKYICGAKYYIWNGPENLGTFSGKALYVFFFFLFFLFRLISFTGDVHDTNLPPINTNLQHPSAMISMSTGNLVPSKAPCPCNLKTDESKHW